MRSMRPTSSCLSQPLACAAAEAAVETVIRAATDELGSLVVSVQAASSAACPCVASSVWICGSKWYRGSWARASTVRLESSGFQVDVGSPLGQTPPNLAEPTAVSFDVRLTADDANRSPRFRRATGGAA